jgi:PPP family 3-phenylpropionic acid transporter
VTGIPGEAIRIALFYFVFCGISGFYTPYWPVFLVERGLGPQQIGILYAVGSLIRPLTAPAFGFIADRYLGFRRTLVVLSVLTAGALALFARAHGFAPLLLVTILVMIVWPPMMPLGDAVALGHQAQGRLTYGRVRLWGSVSYILMNLIGGFVLARFGANGIWAAMLFLAVMLVAMSALQHGAAPHYGGGTRPHLRGLWLVLKNKRLALGLIAAALIDSAHTLYYGFGTIHWRAIGISDRTIGFLWSIGVIAEVALLAFAGRWLRGTSGLHFIMIAGTAAVVRWSLTALDLPLPALFAVQLIHALTYSANLLGVMTLISRNAPARFAGSIQGTYAALAAGLFASTAMAVSGRLYSAFGAHAYFAMAAIAGLGVVVAALARHQARAGVAAVS